MSYREWQAYRDGMKAPWSRDEAIAVLCRSLASLLEANGREGDADAARYAETVLRRPDLQIVAQEAAELRALLETTQAERDAALVRIGLLEAALREHGTHSENCALQLAQFHKSLRAEGCNCGLDAALKETA